MSQGRNKIKMTMRSEMKSEFVARETGFCVLRYETEDEKKENLWGHGSIYTPSMTRRELSVELGWRAAFTVVCEANNACSSTYTSRGKGMQVLHDIVTQLEPSPSLVKYPMLLTHLSSGRQSVSSDGMVLSRVYMKQTMIPARFMLSLSKGTQSLFTLIRDRGPRALSYICMLHRLVVFACCIDLMQTKE